MQLSLEQIRSVTCGAQKVEQQPDGLRFQRMTDAHLEVYRETNPTFYNKAFSNAGISFSFVTDSAFMELDISIEKGRGRSYGTVEVFANGNPIGNISNYDYMELPRAYAELSYPGIRKKERYTLGDGRKHIEILLPRVASVCLHELILDDEAIIQPVIPEKKVLVFGDSITQGFDCLRPSSHYIHTLCKALDAQEYNRGIGGEKFAPWLAACDEDFKPDYIVVAYGTNDWRRTNPELLEQRCEGFFLILAEKYPNVPVIAITPVWRSDIEAHGDEIKFESFHQVEECVLRHTATYPNIIVIRGFDLIPHDVSYFADFGLHPNDQGDYCYGKNLLAALKEKGFPIA